MWVCEILKPHMQHFSPKGTVQIHADLAHLFGRKISWLGRKEDVNISLQYFPSLKNP